MTFCNDTIVGMEKLDQPRRLTYSVAEVATILGVSTGVVYKLVNTGEIHSLKFGDRRVVPRIVLEKMLGMDIEATA